MGGSFELVCGCCGDGDPVHVDAGAVGCMDRQTHGGCFACACWADADGEELFTACDLAG